MDGAPIHRYAMNRLLLDGNNIVMRFYYASEDIRDARTPQGVPIGITQALINFVGNAIKSYAPDEALLIWDEYKSWRHRLDPDYKGARLRRRAEIDPDEADRLDELHQVDIPLARRVLEALGVRSMSVPYFEADDVIANIINMPSACGGGLFDDTLIMSTDNDFVQLVSPRVRLLDIRSDVITHGKPDGTIWKGDEMIARTALHFLAYRMVCGDTSDSIKGLPGVGPKRANTLLTFRPRRQAVTRAELLVIEWVRAMYDNRGPGLVRWLVDAQMLVESGAMGKAERLMSLSTGAYGEGLTYGTGFTLSHVEGIIRHKYRRKITAYPYHKHRMKLLFRSVGIDDLGPLRFAELLTPFKRLHELTDRAREVIL